LLEKARARGLGQEDEIPEDLADEAVSELFGGWTPEAMRFRVSLERFDARYWRRSRRA